MRMDTAGPCSCRLAPWDMSLSHSSNFLGFLWDYYLFEMKIRSDRQKVKHSDIFIYYFFLGGWVRREGNINLAGNYLAKQRYEGVKIRILWSVYGNKLDRIWMKLWNIEHFQTISIFFFLLLLSFVQNGQSHLPWKAETQEFYSTSKASCLQYEQ